MLHKFSEGKPYNVIALCMTRFKSYDQVRLINELCKDCGQTGIKVIIFSSVTDLYNGGVNDIGEAQIFSSFEPERFDAVVVLSETFKNSEVLGKLISRSKRADVPVISIDREIEGCINIEFDYSNAFEQIACLIAHESYHTGYSADLEEETLATSKEAACWTRVKVASKVYPDSRLTRRLDKISGLYLASSSNNNLVQQKIASNGFYRNQLGLN